MRLEPALARWAQAGLIDQATAEAISTFEKRQNRLHPVLMTLGGLGGLAVVLGAMALVGANWASIPGAIKLGATLLVGAGLAAALWRAEDRAPRWIHELIRLLYVGWVLAAIAITGQVFQLGGSSSSAITWWFLLAGPVWSATRSRFVAAGFLVALLAVCFTVQEVLVGHIADASWLWVPLVCPAVVIGLLHIPRIQERRPELAATSRWVFGTVLAGAATVSSILVAHDVFDEPPGGTRLAVLLGGLVFAGLVSRWRPMPGRWSLVAMAGTYALAALYPLTGVIGGGDIVSALLFIGWMGLLAAAAHESSHQGLFRVATFFIAVRLLWLYAAYAGGLNSLGVSLLGGGVLMLLLTFAWYRSIRLLGEPT